MRSKFLSRDYKEELANIAETKGFTQSAENLLLSMAYKIEDSYNNYKTVKRKVPTQNEFLEQIVKSVQEDCESIEIAEPRSDQERELKENKCKIMTESDAKTHMKKVISYPNEKTLLYGVAKVAIPPLKENLSIEEQAIATAVNIGKCISTSEVIRDFTGWTWSISENEIESTECNVIYIFLSLLLGYQFMQNFDIKRLEKSLPTQLFHEIKKVSTQFFMSYDKTQNETILKKIYEDKQKLEKMKNQAEYVNEITETKKQKLLEIREIDGVLSSPKTMREKYLQFNNSVPDEQKIFSVSHYEEKLQNDRQDIMDEIETYNKMQNPIEFVREKEKLQYEIKFYEEKTDISKLQKEFLKCFAQKVEITENRREILDLLYEIRYLNFLPKCKMKLTSLEEKIIPKAINYNIIAPISNNNIIDYRILKGIFQTQVISLESLLIRLSSSENCIHVELFDGDILELEYDVQLPEGSTIEIRKSKKMKIFG